jgi:large subunit ribosomal protein L22
MQVVATSKAVRQTSRKVGLVAALVRGRSVEDALIILEHTPKRAATAVRKTIASAKANAENNHHLDAKTLQIVELDVGPAASMKRYRPIARGSANPYKIRTSNIRVVVEGREMPKKSVKKQPEKKASAKRKGKVDSTTEKESK